MYQTIQLLTLDIAQGRPWALPEHTVETLEMLCFLLCFPWLLIIFGSRSTSCPETKRQRNVSQPTESRKRGRGALGADDQWSENRNTHTQKPNFAQSGHRYYAHFSVVNTELQREQAINMCIQANLPLLHARWLSSWHQAGTHQTTRKGRGQTFPTLQALQGNLKTNPWRKTPAPCESQSNCCANNNNKRMAYKTDMWPQPHTDC